MSGAAAVSEQRQWDRLMAMARIGAIPGDGVNRACLTELDRQARRLLIGWANEIGASATVDAAANLWLRREGTDPCAAAVVTGSHMDTQPNGGRFDGIYGVIAGLEAMTALHDVGARLRRPIEVVAWTSEEAAASPPAAWAAWPGAAAAVSRNSPTWSIPTASASPMRSPRISPPSRICRGGLSADSRTPMSRRISSRGRGWKPRDATSASSPASRAAGGSP